MTFDPEIERLLHSAEPPIFGVIRFVADQLTEQSRGGNWQ